MEGILILGVILFIVGSVIQFVRRKSGAKEEKKEWLPYIKKQYLLTPTEHKFFNILEKAIENRYYIFPQIVLSNIVLLKGRGSFKGGYRNRIDKKTVDFVLFDKQDISPVLVIELDDYTHNRDSRRKRDEKVDKILNRCNIPIIHTPFISEEKLRLQINLKLKISS